MPACKFTKKTLLHIFFHIVCLIPATNVIINIKNEQKNIILTHYKHHTINNMLHEFLSNFCINNALCKLIQNSISMLLQRNYTASVKALNLPDKTKFTSVNFVS